MYDLLNMINNWPDNSVKSTHQNKQQNNGYVIQNCDDIKYNTVVYRHINHFTANLHTLHTWIH